ncbi:hypothetical protein FCV25MIE_15128 [Fagus crenata]
MLPPHTFPPWTQHSDTNPSSPSGCEPPKAEKELVPAERHQPNTECHLLHRQPNAERQLLHCQPNATHHLLHRQPNAARHLLLVCVTTKPLPQTTAAAQI